MRLSTLLSKHLTDAIRNLVKKAPLIKNDGRSVKTACVDLIHNLT
jgi:hypothetical protein